MLKKIVLTAVVFMLRVMLYAHPMPHSVMLLDVKPDGVNAELQWPLKEFHFVFPEENLDSNVHTLTTRKDQWLDSYLLQHMHVADETGKPWHISILSKEVITDEQSLTGKYNELVFHLWLQPPAGVSSRHFTMRYDAIMHQLITHKMFIRIRQDWDGGLSEKDSMDADLGVLMMNPANNTVPPVTVNLDEGSKWKGFKNMVSLGMSHIAEGTDHLLFLLVLMLPAPLIARSSRWAESGGTKYSAVRLLKIASAFTVGHSLTLLAGAAGWLRLPSQPVEILIALSILVGAVHALRPLFPGREVFVAAGFGLVHGLAFAATLSDLHIDGTRMALSILGFNIGIELMQLFVILLFVPWLVILSRYRYYRWILIAGAMFALVASLSWMVERITSRPNKIGAIVGDIARQAQWIVLVIAVIAIISYVVTRRKEQTSAQS